MPPKERTEPKSGIANPNVMDLVTHDPKSDEYALIIVETRKWDEIPQLLEQLQEKINNYFHFALDGELIKRFPEAVGKPVRIQLDCAMPPSGKTAELVARVKQELGEKGIRFVINVL